jgi:hypothetical protein
VTCRLFMVVAAVVTLLMAASAEAASKKAKPKAAATTPSASSSTKPKATPRTRGTRKQGTSRSPKVNLQLGLRPRVSIGSGNAKVTLGAGGIGGSTRRSRRRSYY